VEVAAVAAVEVALVTAVVAAVEVAAVAVVTAVDLHLRSTKNLLLRNMSRMHFNTRRSNSRPQQVFSISPISKLSRGQKTRKVATTYPRMKTFPRKRTRCLAPERRAPSPRGDLWSTRTETFSS
jgi:hypothetical protein